MQQKSFSPADYIPRLSLNRDDIHFVDVDWSILESKQGDIDTVKLADYIQQCRQLSEQGLRICVTLFGEEEPQWFTAEGGFVSLSGTLSFQNYLKTIVSVLGQFVDFWQPFKTLPAFQNREFGLIRETRTKVFQANIALCQFACYTEIHRQLGYSYLTEDGSIHHVAVFTPEHEPMNGWLQNVSVAKKTGFQISANSILDDSSIVSISSSSR